MFLIKQLLEQSLNVEKQYIIIATFNISDKKYYITVKL